MTHVVVTGLVKFFEDDGKKVTFTINNAIKSDGEWINNDFRYAIDKEYFPDNLSLQDGDVVTVETNYLSPVVTEKGGVLLYFNYPRITFSNGEWESSGKGGKSKQSRGGKGSGGGRGNSRNRQYDDDDDNDDDDRYQKKSSGNRNNRNRR